MTAAGQTFASIGGFKVPTDDRRPLETPRGFNDPAKAMATLDTVAGEVEKEYGSLNVKWGDVMPSLSADGKKLYYLVRSYGLRSWNQGRLWVADLETGQRQQLLTDFQVLHYSVSGDGQQVVFVSVDEQGRNPVWLSSLTAQLPPRQVSKIGRAHV